MQFSPTELFPLKQAGKCVVAYWKITEPKKRIVPYFGLLCDRVGVAFVLVGGVPEFLSPILTCEFVTAESTVRKKYNYSSSLLLIVRDCKAFVYNSASTPFPAPHPLASNNSISDTCRPQRHASLSSPTSASSSPAQLQVLRKNCGNQKRSLLHTGLSQGVRINLAKHKPVSPLPRLMFPRPPSFTRWRRPPSSPPFLGWGECDAKKFLSPKENFFLAQDAKTGVRPVHLLGLRHKIQRPILVQLCGFSW